MLRQKLRNIKIRDILMLIIFVMALGFRTNYYSNEKNISTTIMIICFVVMVILDNGLIRIKSSTKYVIWYVIFTGFCALSGSWAIHENNIYVKALFKDIMIPLIFIILAMEMYLRNTQSSVRFFNCIIAAEMITLLRAIIYTPWAKLFGTMDTRLFGTNLGINYNDITTQIALVFLMVSYLFYFESKKYRPVLLVLILFLIISGSRKALIVSVMGMILLYLINIGENKILLFKRLLIILLVGIIASLIVFKIPIMYEFVGQKIANVFSTMGQKSTEMSTVDIDHSLHGRAVLREKAREQFYAHPGKGIGYYCFQYTNSYGLYAHNNYLEILADLGLLGFGLYYIMYLIIFRIAFDMFLRKRRMKSKEYILAFIFIMILMVMEYAQITYIRLFALVPLLTVAMGMESAKGNMDYVSRQ